MKTSTTRFSDRVEDYIKYRPSYPREIIRILEKETGFNSGHVIADIGSGTGISSKLFIQNNNIVYAVEPNKEMREAAEKEFESEKKFISIDGTAESTTLKNNSIDLIFCGQAYHWFDVDRTKIEFARILKQGGITFLVWNDRSREDALQNEYEQILVEKIPEYSEVTHRNINTKQIEKFFSPKPLHHKVIPNFQVMDLAFLKGRLQSSSYCPKEGSVHTELMRSIEQLFAKYNTGGLITFQYETKMYWG